MVRNRELVTISIGIVGDYALRNADRQGVIFVHLVKIRNCGRRIVLVDKGKGNHVLHACTLGVLRRKGRSRARIGALRVRLAHQLYDIA